MRHCEGLSTARAAGMAGVVFVLMMAASGTLQAETDPAAGVSAAADPAASAASEVSAVEVPPVIAAALAKLKDKAFAGRASAEDVAAAEAFYAARKDPLWVDAVGFTAGGKAMATEISKAAEWGLEPRAFALPDMSAALASPDALGEADARLTLAMLTYARHARGGRTRPLSISQMLDLTPPVKDPAAVLNEISSSTTPAAYLTGLHPRHDQFQKLQKELVRRLGPVEPIAAVQDPSLQVKMPKGATLKEGSLHDDISLLRARLKVPAPYAGRETYFDAELAAALKAFQTEAGIKADGRLTARTRTALNRAGEVEQPDNPRETQRLIVNMERWRWMPEDLGAVHVVNNVPEYVTRTFKDGKVVFKEKIIVGLPTWPTPSFSAEMKTIVFNPSWGVPDGIKAKELKPRLQKAGGGGFFDQLFGGGGGGSSVLKAYGLTAYRNGKPVNPDTIDWSSADLRAYSFIQPPGAKNPLGFVKFMFPNTHDVYMHDTTQRELFGQSKRPYSHGCIRVQNPGRFAEVLLAEDKGWSAERVAQARRASETISLDQHIWVHNVYLTTWIEDDGRVAAFGDVYGLDSRVSRAIGGGNVPSASSVADDIETSSIEDDEDAPSGETKKKNKNKSSSKSKSTSNYRVPSSFSDAMSGLTAN